MRRVGLALEQRLLRNLRLRRLLPPRAKVALFENRQRLVRVVRRSDLRNVYHCCVHRAGSQWIRKMLGDLDVYRVTGLRPYAYGPHLPHGRETREYPDRWFDAAFPANTIVSPLYIPYPNFAAIPKPGSWRAFFVSRDPRDIVVSWFFSTAISHPTRNNPSLQQARNDLVGLEKEQGLLYAIQALSEGGLFAALRSWIGIDEPHVLLLRYEDLVGEEREGWLERLLDHCDVRLSATARRALLKRYSFEELSGRRRGHEDQQSLMRKGVAGDWRNHFTPAVQAAFDDATGDLTEQMGYDHQAV